MKRTLNWLALRVIIAAAACTGHHAAPETDAASVASLDAEMQLVGQDTTWVMRGHGYLLVGRTRGDLAAVHASIERAASTFTRIYPHDSLVPIIATVRRVSPPGKPYVGAAPVPSTLAGAIVELPVTDPKAAPRDARPMPGGTAAPAVRAWMSARASRLTGTAARLDQSRGESGDPRVPAWSIAMIESAGDDAAIDEATKVLAEHPESLIPLARYFTMESPTTGAPGEGRGRGQPGGKSGPTGTRGGGGGMGGMGGGIGGGMGGIGGMGGRGGGGGRGGMGGGRGGGAPGGSRGGSRGGEGQRMLTGPALFAAQSAVLSRYLGRVGYDVIGELTDAQIMGKPIDEVLARHNLGTLGQADADWRMWLNARANSLQGE